MKEGIHPQYFDTTIKCACGNVIETGSTKENITVEICSKCHPFFTGKQKLVDTGGRVEKFIITIVLIVVVLFQSGKEAGLSGSIAGGSETFFGKNKGRTIDAILEKWTSVIAIAFLVTSIALFFLGKGA